MSYYNALEKYKAKGKKTNNHLALLDDMGYDKPTYGGVRLEPLHKNAIVPYGDKGECKSRVRKGFMGFLRFFKLSNVDFKV